MQKFSAFFSRSAFAFSQYTSVAGFGQIGRATGWTATVFWLIVTVACVYLTIRDCSTTIVQYLDETSLSTVTFMRNKSVSYPGSSICFELDTDLLPIRNLSRLDDEEVTSAFAACILNSSYYEMEVNDFYGTFKDHVHAAAKLLTFYNLIETGKDKRLAARNSTAIRLSNSLRTTLIREGVGSRQLANALAFVFCRRMNVEMTYSYKDHVPEEFDFCRTATPVLFGAALKAATHEHDMLCYNIEQFTNFTSMESMYEISFNPYNIVAKADATAEMDTAYFSVDSVPMKTDLTSDFVAVQYGRCVKVEIELLLRIKSLSKRSAPCDAHYSHLECIVDCRMRAAIADCNCSMVGGELYIVNERQQLSWRDNTTSSCFMVHSPAAYESCILGPQRTTHQCDHCVYRCEVNTFNLREWNCTTRAPKPNATAVFYYLHRVSYCSVEEHLVYDVAALLSALGGIIGLWLGAGFIGLLEAVIFLPKLFAEFAVCRGAKQARSDWDEERIRRLELTVSVLARDKLVEP